MHIRARRLLVNDQDALASCSRPPPPFDVRFHGFVNLTVPVGVTMVAVEVAGGGAGSVYNTGENVLESATTNGGDSECIVAGVKLSANGGRLYNAVNGAAGEADITGAVETTSNAFTLAGAGAGGGIPESRRAGLRGGNGGLAVAHIRVSAGDTILCTAGLGGQNNDYPGHCYSGGEHGWIRIRW